MPGPRVASQPEELPPWVARHLADAAALLGQDPEGVVVFIPPGLGSSRWAIEQWAASMGLVVDYALPADDVELGAGELIRLTPGPPEEEP